MKQSILAAILLLAVSAPAVTVTDALLDAIAWVESRNDDSAVGDSGRAIGRYQIWATYLADANAFAGTSYAHADMTDPAAARAMVRAYLEHYGRAYERRTGRPATPEVLARIHNGGPNGWRKAATRTYWKRVRSALRRKGGR